MGRDQVQGRVGGRKKAGTVSAPALLYGEPDLTVRVVRDIFNEDFTSLVVSGDEAWGEVSQYVEDVAPDLAPRLQRWTAEEDVFAAYRIDESLSKAMDRKVWLPSGGSLVIDRTEAMTVVDVNTGKFIGSGGNLEETVTKNNLEAAEEIVRQLRLRDIGGIIVIDFIDMVLESNRDLVVRRLLECLGRDRTKHQVAEVTSLGLVQMTRKRVGRGLIEVFSEQCEHCGGRGIIVHTEVIDRSGGTSGGSSSEGSSGSARSGRGRRGTATGTAQAGNGSNGSGSPRAPGPTTPSGRPGRRPRRSPPPRTPRPCAASRSASTRADLEAAGAAAQAAAPASADATSGSEAVEPQAGIGCRLGRLPARAVPVAPELDGVPVAPELDGVPVAPELDGVPVGSDTEPDLVPVAAPVAADPEPEPAARRGRRKRGRVVAPAGPPRGTASDDDAAGSEAGAEPMQAPTP